MSDLKAKSPTTIVANNFPQIENGQDYFLERYTFVTTPGPRLLC